MSTDDLLLSCDWGTSSFRLRLVSRGNGRVQTEHATADGAQPIASASPSVTARRAAFRAVLAHALEAIGVAQHRSIPLVISGMACSTIGWLPLGYAGLPAHVSGADFVTGDRRIDGRKVRFVSGLRADCDVMRGEECELAGLFAAGRRQVLARDCLVVLPGTHSKHVRLKRNRITDFVTHPTGELFSLALKHSTFGGAMNEKFSPRSFRAGVLAARQLGMGPALFKARASTVLGLMPREHTADFLSGVLIGSEIVCLPSGVPVVLGAGPALAPRYRLALRTIRRRESFIPIEPREMAQALIRGHLQLSTGL